MPTLSARKRAVRQHADEIAPTRDAWIEKNRYFHEEDERYMRFLVPEGLRVLDVGCGTGRLLAKLRPSRGVGLDLSPGMIAEARARHPDLEFRVGDAEDPADLAALGAPFDVIVLSDTIGFLDDCDAALTALHPLCHRDTRLIVAYYSPLWEPLLALAQLFGQHMPQPDLNWLATEDIDALLELADFDVVKREWRTLVPKRLLGLGPLVNRFLATLPLVRLGALRNYIVARSTHHAARPEMSVSVVVPCRNERGNVRDAVDRMPRFGTSLEILFVEGGSRDGTAEEVERVIAERPDLDVRLLRQDGAGKGDAVRKGFENARGDVLIILDGDLTVPPESLPKFYRAILDGKGEFVNGSRLVYPRERESMRFLNMLANRGFALLFTWLLNQRFTDTLCGTKVLTAEHYRRIAAGRAYFGDFDPFGDFDLVFGAAKQNLKCVEVPVRYAARRYGETQISRFRHGWLLLQMVAFAYRKLKAP